MTKKYKPTKLVFEQILAVAFLCELKLLNVLTVLKNIFWSGEIIITASTVAQLQFVEESSRRSSFEDYSLRYFPKNAVDNLIDATDTWWKFMSVM